MELKIPPIKPVNGRICVQPLPYKPSSIIEVLSTDNADIFDGYVVALSDHQILPVFTGSGKKRKVTGYMHAPHDVAVGDRVIFKPKYAKDDFVQLNGQDYRILDSNEILIKFEEDRPEGFANPLTGEITPATPQTTILH